MHNVALREIKLTKMALPCAFLNLMPFANLNLFRVHAWKANSN
jgi:hypothetical protein